MWSSDRRVFLWGALAALGGCGFTPAYGPTGRAQALQGQINLPTPQDRNQFLLNQRLEERLGHGGVGRFVLDLRLAIRENALGTTADGQTTRYHLVGDADYELKSIATETVLTSGSTTGFTAYSATGTTVATLAAERDAYERLMILLADQIVDRLLLAAADLPS